MTTFYFVRPLDALMLRGNRAFGAAGEHGEALLPPWPSVFAGAFRAAILGRDAEALAAFSGGSTPQGLAGEVLGTPEAPGRFRLTWLTLARVNGSHIIPYVPLPADLVAWKENGADKVRLSALYPAPLPEGVVASTALPMTPLLKVKKQVKPEGGWLDGEALAAHLVGRTPAAPTKTGLYKRETRLGIALAASARTADEGKLYTTETVTFETDAGFLVGIEGAGDCLPEHGLLRIGGDGRGAEYQRIEFAPPPPAADEIEKNKRFRLVLATPGLFAAGWLPSRLKQEGKEWWLAGAGFTARLAAAAVSRFEVVSGWDLARWRPKDALRAAPAGSVYWFDQFAGEAGKLVESVEAGLWGDNPDTSRRAEGFNLAWLAAWN